MKVLNAFFAATFASVVVLANGLVSAHLEHAVRANYAVSFEESSKIALAKSQTSESAFILKLLDEDLDFLGGETVLVPPDHFQNIPLVLGIGITPSFKRFFLPSEDWLLRIWWNCDAGETSVDAILSRSKTFGGPNGFRNYVQSCYQNLESQELRTLAERYGASYAIAYNSQCNSPDNEFRFETATSVICLLEIAS